MPKNKKTEYGADAEADVVLARLPRKDPMVAPFPEPNAWVYIDASGRLCIQPVGGGWLGLEEKNLAYLHGDTV